jgi:LuxR family quorum sensing-dependent transcriptional regulator
MLMSGSTFQEHLFSFIHELWNAGTAEEVIASFKARSTSLGFPVFAFGELDAAHPNRSAMHVVEWPADWFKLYLHDRFFEHDPLMDFVIQGHVPFTWSERKAAGGLTRAHIRGFEAARNFGWRGGLTVSLPRGGTRFGILSLAGPEDDHLSADEKAALSAMSVLAYEKLRGLAGVQDAKPPYAAGLSHRELDCLKYVACGLGDGAIAEKLGISVSTTHEHVERAKRKLGTRTRAHAVAIAVLLGLITT